MNPFEIDSYPGDDISIKNEILTYKVNKDWIIAELKNQQGIILGRGWLPSGLRILAENEAAKNFKIDDEVVYDNRRLINKNNSANINEDNFIIARGNTFKIASITFTYEPNLPQKYYNGKLLVEFVDAGSYILPAVIESNSILLTGDYKLKLWHESQGQANIYFSKYADTWLSIVDSNNQFRGALNFGILQFGIHINAYFGLTWDRIASRLLRCRPDTPPLDRVANLEILNTNNFVFGGQYENKTLKDIAVYGPAPKSSKSLNDPFKQDFFLYRLPSSQKTPENISFYGVYLPADSTAVTSDGSFISGPKAVLIPSKKFDVKQNDSDRYILPNNAEIINPGDILNLEVPSYSQSELGILPFPDPKAIQQKPVPSSRRIRELAIISSTNTINYFEFIRLNHKFTYKVEFSQPAPIIRWSLFAPTGQLMTTSYLAPKSMYTLSSNDTVINGINFRDQVEKIGLSAFGSWKLKCEADTYFDFVTFELSQLGGPQEILEDSTTTSSYLNFRKLPGKGDTKIGILLGIEFPVKITDKAMLDNTIWYKAVAHSSFPPIGSLSEPQPFWVSSPGVSAILSWENFLTQLRKFETIYNNLSITERITKLRQMSHNKNLPFDDIIGVPEGEEYLDTRSFVRSEWQILEHSLQKVRVPDGSVVDIYHLMVGLDVLPLRRRVEDKKIEIIGIELPISVGQNYSAATWSGDIGAGAADAIIGKDSTWEAKNNIPPRGNPSRTFRLNDLQKRYYLTRAPESDLFGDIDAWGINNIRSDQSLDSIEKILLQYYSKDRISIERKISIEIFLNHYDFNTSTRLISQESRADISRQIELFAKVWIIRHQIFEPDPFLYNDSDLNEWYVDPMTDRFLNWLDDLASRYGVSIEE